MERRIVDLESVEFSQLPPAQQGALVAALIDDWAETQRVLALVWREVQHQARSGALQAEIAMDWGESWRRFWGAICGEGILAQHSDAVAAFAAGAASQHLMRWRRVLDRALLEETASAFFHFLAGSLEPADTIMLACRRRAQREFRASCPTGEVFDKIDLAAASMANEHGLAGLTFRGVAERAKVTLGMVTWHFGDKENLQSQALRVVVEHLTCQGQNGLAKQLPDEPEAAAHALLRTRFGGSDESIASLDRLALWLSRQPAGGVHQGVIRSLENSVEKDVLARLLAMQTRPAASLVEAFTSVLDGAWSLSAGLGAAEGLAVGRKALAPFIAIPAPR